MTTKRMRRNVPLSGGLDPSGHPPARTWVERVVAVPHLFLPRLWSLCPALPQPQRRRLPQRQPRPLVQLHPDRHLPRPLAWVALLALVALLAWVALALVALLPLVPPLPQGLR